MSCWFLDVVYFDLMGRVGFLFQSSIRFLDDYATRSIKKLTSFIFHPRLKLVANDSHISYSISPNKTASSLITFNWSNLNKLFVFCTL